MRRALFKRTSWDGNIPWKPLNLIQWFFVSKQHPFLVASPDAFMQGNCCSQGVVEVKCLLCAHKRSIEEVVAGVRSFCLKINPGGTLQLKHNHTYHYQCKLQIFVTRRNFCDFVVWSDDQLHNQCITLNLTLFQTTVPTAEKFWKWFVLPELLGKWYTHDQP